MALVDTLEGRNRLALILVQCRTDDITIFQNNFGLCWISLVREGVLHPVLVITL
jgi:hypothetical protein